MQSHLTSAEATPLFRTKVLEKYDVQYFRCPDTGYIQTEKPYWLPEAYQDAITALDIGLVRRNLELQTRALPIILAFFDSQKRFLDYAGGYGMFVRLMRDAGLDFYRQDPYCENLFAKHFDVTDLPDTEKFELLTAFEVFEHWENPKEELKKALQYGKNILFSTELQPTPPPERVEDWWYFSPSTGQHVSLYTKKALATLADQFGLHFYTDGHGLHLFTKEQLSKDPFQWEYNLSNRIFNRLKNLLHRLDPRYSRQPASRLQTDYEWLKNGR